MKSVHRLGVFCKKKCFEATRIGRLQHKKMFFSRPLFIYFRLFNTVDNKQVNKQMFSMSNSYRTDINKCSI